jgi:uncharacterized zinc-type alcohol dehydrogenase-like protein
MVWLLGKGYVSNVSTYMDYYSLLHHRFYYFGYFFLYRVPGHEIAGTVVAVGANVKKFKVGDRAGVGCMVDSCRSCRNCRAGEEQFCQTGMIGTYGSKFRYPHCVEYNAEGGNKTYGGYSQSMVVDENYTVRIPHSLELSRAAPLLCAGITTYSPLLHFGLRPHHRYAVAGLGGLGHMAVKFGIAFGAHVTVLSRGSAKKDSAMGELGAHAYVDMSNEEEVKAVMGSFDFILNTIAADHDVGLYMRLLTLDGSMVIVGAPPNRQSMFMHSFIEGRRSLSGSLIGGIKETQDMLDFCARKNINCDVEVIRADQINEAYERTLKGDVKYRFVIDTATM